MPHPLGGSTLPNWLKTLRKYGGRDVRWGKALKISMLVAAAAPFRCYERIRWSRAVAAVSVREPIFICGHWQSGHTLTQLLLSCDPQFATLRLRHAVQPGACLSMQPVLRWFLKGRLPQKRLVDDMPNHLEAPQGDDFALGLLTGASFYYAWYFPRHADVVFREYVMMEGLPGDMLEDWKRNYRCLLQKLLIDSGRKCVAVRNACNTARMTHLLSAFPDARFIYCHRDPYEVFAASLERWEALTRAFSLSRDTLAPGELEELTLSWYEQLLKRYLADRSQVPTNRLVEVAYADLRDCPLDVMQRVYETFGIGGIADLRPLMDRLHRQHPWTLAGCEPLTEAQRDSVRGRWAFAFDEWGYSK
jgi:hypothetical protein